MGNRALFRTSRGKLAPKADAVNEAGGLAYRLSPKHALAQYAATGCLNQTYYATAAAQLETVLRLCGDVEPEFIAKTAVYCREHGYMKDMPALLCAALTAREDGLPWLKRTFGRVLDNGRMLRGFVQIVRSGVVGRKSFGSAVKRLIQEWLEGRTDEQLFRDSVGQKPSMADIVKMVHPRPAGEQRSALYAYMLDREYRVEQLPPIVREYEAYKGGESGDVPNVPFQMLDSLGLGAEGWTQICRNAKWQMTRMNLNTFQRHGVFGTEEEPNVEMIELVAERLSNPKAIRSARAFPYQLLAAYRNTRTPRVIREALQDAMEVAIENVPAIDGQVYVFPDVSGSMHDPVTGHRRGATTKVRCVDAAALIAAAIVRKNETARVIPFKEDVVDVDVNPRDSVMTNAAKMSSLPAGGTNCSAPLALLNKRKASADMVIYVSDYESWVDRPAGHGSWLSGYGGFSPTETMRQWEAFRSRNADAKMVCIDLTPYETSQVREDARDDILQIGGFSDTVFTVLADFAAGRMGPEHWVGLIGQVEL